MTDRNANLTADIQLAADFTAAALDETRDTAACLRLAADFIGSALAHFDGDLDYVLGSIRTSFENSTARLAEAEYGV